MRLMNSFGVGIGGRKTTMSSSLGCVETVLELVDQQQVADLQRRLHRARRNEERADDERDEDQRHQTGHDERVEVLAQHQHQLRRAADRGAARRCGGRRRRAGTVIFMFTVSAIRMTREQADEPEEFERVTG